jgi:hypothetical protein
LGESPAGNHWQANISRDFTKPLLSPLLLFILASNIFSLVHISSFLCGLVSQNKTFNVLIATDLEDDIKILRNWYQEQRPLAIGSGGLAGQELFVIHG